MYTSSKRSQLSGIPSQQFSGLEDWFKGMSWTGMGVGAIAVILLVSILVKKKK